ncbi:phenylalanine--tRNA ligase subunit beta [Candidatus Babeliales bacterium]|nr:phenylalanine--tRNA ligase subunit beta [Candidatus Babeliales bacterium]
MKLSIAWIFDHINARWHDIPLDQLVDRFNKTTAEIEDVEHCTIDLVPFTCGRVIAITDTSVILQSDEWSKEITLPGRSDASVGSYFLVCKDRYATVRDFGCGKDGLLPALTMTDEDAGGVWKSSIETEDYIIEVDNKSITNRPDMWSHRGFAREIAALFDLPLKPLSEFTARHEVRKYDACAAATDACPISIEVKAPDACPYFSGLYVKTISSQPSALWMAHRLARTDNRPINGIVDVTNYVMLDLGQPMHAFDVNKIGSTKIVPRMARPGEKLELLDDTQLELTDQDLVISNGDTALALAGVMGGKRSGIDTSTTSVFLEAACFDAGVIRRSAVRCKTRTEASARFEKSLDPAQTVPAIQRFIKLYEEIGGTLNLTTSIKAVGRLPQPTIITIEHATIETLLGCSVPSQTVVKILEKLAFKVEQSRNPGSVLYTITVPTFRATKDVTIKEDIVEEVGRFYGYTNIEPVLPSMQMQPSDMSRLYQIRGIKKHMAYANRMHELQSYALYDEEFLKELCWEPAVYISLINPVADTNKRLATSLIPNVLKAVQQNALKEDELRFFELNPIWPHGTQEPIVENLSLASVVYKRRGEVDFYEEKAALQSLFSLLGMHVTWKKVESPAPWYSSTQTAQLLHGRHVVGYAGMMDESFLNRVCEGKGFIAEIDGDYIASYRHEPVRMHPLSKYQDVTLDISMLVPLQVTVDKLQAVIHGVDGRIVRVQLIDFFEKKEWKDKRSLTFRYVVQDHHATLDKGAIDTIVSSVEHAVAKQGVEVR